MNKNFKIKNLKLCKNIHYDFINYVKIISH